MELLGKGSSAVVRSLLDFLATKDLSAARPEDWGIWTACPKPDHRVPTKLDSEPASSDF